MPSELPDFSGLRVAVAGDLVVDHYLHAQPTRLSREAPVLVLRRQTEHYGAGGAANAARNLRALGAETRLLGFAGRDERAAALLSALSEERIDTSGVIAVDGWDTPTKTRVLAADARRTPQQVLRIDREPELPLGERELAALADGVRRLAGEVDALLVSDYGYGAAGAALASAARSHARAGATVVVDPRACMPLFEGSTAMTPNLEELALFAGRPVEELDDRAAMIGAAARALERCRPRWLLVTLGNQGMALFGEGMPREGLTIPASGPEQVVDVSGAGDTAAAAFALALAAELPAPEAMRIANAAAGVVVMRPGTATCGTRELEKALRASPRPVQPAREEPGRGQPAREDPGRGQPAREDHSRAGGAAAARPTAAR